MLTDRYTSQTTCAKYLHDVARRSQTKLMGMCVRAMYMYEPLHDVARRSQTKRGGQTVDEGLAKASWRKREGRTPCMAAIPWKKPGEILQGLRPGALQISDTPKRRRAQMGV